VSKRTFQHAQLANTSHVVTRSRVLHQRKQNCRLKALGVKSGCQSSVGREFQDAGPDE